MAKIRFIENDTNTNELFAELILWEDREDEEQAVLTLSTDNRTREIRGKSVVIESFADDDFTGSVDVTASYEGKVDIEELVELLYNKIQEKDLARNWCDYF